MHKLYLSISLIVLVLSCKTDSLNPNQFPNGLEYYPIVTGNYTIYKITSWTRIPGGFKLDSFQLKELIGDTIHNFNEVEYRVERFIRNIGDTTWNDQPDSVWTVRVTGNEIIETQDNIRYVKLTLPIYDGKTWNGNAENDLGAQNYSVDQIGKPFTVAGQVFSKTLTVTEMNDTNLVQKNLTKEVYAKDSGLVYRYSERLNLDFNNGDTTSGSYSTQKFQERGHL